MSITRSKGKGEKGDSAYQIAVKEGFTGTESEWLLTLKGEKGDPGVGGAEWGGITGTLSNQTDLNTSLSGKANTNHGHAYSELTGKPDLSSLHGHSNKTLLDTYTQSEANLSSAVSLKHSNSKDHDHANKTALDNVSGINTGDQDLNHSHDGVYEPANPNIQNHILTAHAPSNAQKNSDITKQEIEDKLTGAISSHSHAGVGASYLIIPIVDDPAGFTWTNMPLALTFLNGSYRCATKVDLTGYTQCRLIVNKQGTAGASASKLIVKYITVFNTTVANWLDIGTSEVSVAVNTTNNVLVSNWIDLISGAKADVFICIAGSGGDGALDPVFGNIQVQFK